MSIETMERAREIFRGLIRGGFPADIDLLVDAAAGGDAELGHELHRLAAGWRSFLSAFDGESAHRAERAESDDAAALLLAARRGDTNRYSFERPLGRGGMAEVVLALDKVLKRTVAMKVLGGGSPTSAADRADRRRFLREAEVMARLDHPGIAPIFDLGLDSGGRPFFTMRQVDGLTFQQVIERVHRGDAEWTLARAVRALLAACEAVAYAHEQGIVHRDLKPANVMVGRFGETHVIDWGVARLGDLDLRAEHEAPGPDASARDASLTEPGRIVGTPAFLAPERALRPNETAGPATDVYSAGCILYSLLTGSPPYLEPGAAHETEIVLDRLRTGTPVPIGRLSPEAPEELVAIAERAMARRPEDRYRDMVELAEDLRAYLDVRVVRSHRTGWWQELRKWSQRNRLAASLLGVLAVGLVGGLGTFALLNMKLDEALDEAELAQTESARRASVGELLAARDALDRGAYAEARFRLGQVDERWRGWEWHHLGLRQDSGMLAKPLHDAAVHAVAPSPDGTVIATADAKGHVILRDAQDAHEIRSLELGVQLRSLAWLPDGERFLVGLEDGSVELRRATSGALLDRAGGDEEPAVDLAVLSSGEFVVSAHAEWPLTAHAEGSVYEVWAVDGEQLTHLQSLPRKRRVIATAAIPNSSCVLLAAGHDRPQEGGKEPVPPIEGVAVFNLISGEEGPPLEAHGERILCVDVAPDGRSLVMASWEGRASALDVETGDELWNVSLQRDERDSWRPYRVRVAPHGELVAIGGAGLAVQIRDARDGRLVRELAGHTATVSGLAFLDGGARVLSASTNGEVRVFDLDTAPAVLDVSHDYWVVAVAMSRDGTRLATGCRDGALRIFDSATGQLLMQAVAREDNPALHQSQLRKAWGVAWSPDGTRIASSEPSNPASVALPQTNRVIVRDARNGVEAFRTQPVENLLRLWWPATGDEILGADATGTLHRWSAVDGRLLESLGGDGSNAVLSPDATHIAILAGDVVRIVALHDGSEVARFGHRFPVIDAAWSPDGELLCSTAQEVYHSRDPDVVVWEAASGNERFRLESFDVVVNRVAWSPDGKRIATGDQNGSVEVWDSTTRELVFRDRNGGRIDSLAWSPDGRALVSGSTDGIARILRTP